MKAEAKAQGNGYEFDGEDVIPIAPEVTVDGLIKALEQGKVAKDALSEIDAMTSMSGVDTPDDLLQAVDKAKQDTGSDS